MTISYALLHARSADYLRDDIMHGIANVIRRNISIDFPRRMNVERSINSSTVWLKRIKTRLGRLMTECREGSTVNKTPAKALGSK